MIRSPVQLQAPGPRPKTARGVTVPRLLWPLIALAALLLFNLVFTNGFFEIEVRDGRLYGSLIDVLDRAAPVMLVSLGMTLVIATAGVDLSVGAIMAISGATAAVLVAPPDGSIFASFPAGDSLWVILPCALGLAAIIGGASGGLVAFAGVQPIIATLVFMVAGRGIAQLLTDGQVVVFDHAALAVLGNGAFLGLPVSISVTAAAFVVVLVLTRATSLGLFVAATGSNPVASRASGVPARAVLVLTYSLCGVLAGVAGLLAASDIQAADANNCGLYIELDAILAVVLGGTALTGGRFSLVGSILGALLIQCVTTMILSRGIAVEFTLIVKAGVILFACLLQSGKFRSMIVRPMRRATS